MKNKNIFRSVMTISATLFVLGVFGWLASWAILDKPPWAILVSVLALFTGITQGAFVIAILLRTASAKWGAGLYRLTASIALAFLPFAAVMMFVIIVARNSLIPWAGQGDHHLWFNTIFFVARESIYFILFYGLTYKLFKTAQLKGSSGAKTGNHRMMILGLLTTVTYVYGTTIFSWDLGMTLNPHYADTIYGAYYIMTSLFGATALIILLTAFLNKKVGNDYFTPLQFRNLAILATALTIMVFYGWWSQFFPIWYANLPEETHTIYLRIFSRWGAMYGLMMILVSVIPFIALLFKKVRESAAALSAVSVIILVGLWIQQYLYSAIGLIREDRAADLSVFSLPNLSLTAGIAGGFLFVLFSILKRYPNAYMASPAPDSDVADTEADYLFTQPQGW